MTFIVFFSIIFAVSKNLRLTSLPPDGTIISSIILHREAEMLKEFRNFAMRGNVIDLAVGVIIGGAFGKIVTSFVNDILMPPIGLLLGSVNFVDLYVVLKGVVPAGMPLAEAKTIAGAVTWNYGAFLSTIIDFTIITFAIFLVIRAINRMKKQEPAPAPAAPTTKTCPHCATEIPLAATRCPHCTSQL
jgi:large conductance mechanosensitive channel